MLNVFYHIEHFSFVYRMDKNSAIPSDVVIQIVLILIYHQGNVVLSVNVSIIPPGE